jgi:hypothetical protein
VYAYKDGCPFFMDRQREFLLMSVGLSASVVGVLAWAPEKKDCWVLSSGAHLTGLIAGSNPGIEVSELQSQGKKLAQLQFAAATEANDAQCRELLSHYPFEGGDPDYDNKLQQLENYQRQMAAINKHFGFARFFKF